MIILTIQTQEIFCNQLFCNNTTSVFMRYYTYNLNQLFYSAINIVFFEGFLLDLRKAKLLHLL